MSYPPPPGGEPYGGAPEPQEPQPGQQPPEYPPQPGYQPGYPPPGYPQGYPGYPPPAPTHSKATVSLVLGILSLVMCGLFTGIPAMITGRQAKREIAESNGRLSGEGLASAGFITGLIGTILSALTVVAFIGIFAIAAVTSDGFEDSCTGFTSDGEYVEC
jgi:Domain of unknown function (DUF4190)